METEFQSEKTKFPDMDGGDCCTPLWMYLLPLNFKMVKIVKFLRVFYHTKQNYVYLTNLNG